MIPPAKPCRLWPWLVIPRAVIAARYSHDHHVVLIFAMVPTVWSVILFAPGPTLGPGGYYTAIDNLGAGEMGYAIILAGLALGLWLGLCRVIPRSVYRGVIILGVGWWLFLGTSFIASGWDSLVGWQFIAQATYGALAYLSASHDHDRDTARLVARMVNEDLCPELPDPPKDRRRGRR